MRRLAAALDPLGLGVAGGGWDRPGDAAALRAAIRTPIASLEAVYGRSGLLPYLEARAMDVAVIDPMWIGFGESVRMAGAAEPFGVMNVASHLFSGELATAMAANFCAMVPNLRIMEVDLDRVAWHESMLKGSVEIREGHALVPGGVGWGVQPDELGVALHLVAP